jgi:hypothetical protein
MQATSSTHAWATAILDDCHSLVLTQLHALMKRMFENTDTAFQEFIDKAQSNTSQIRFMEAMSIINRNRPHVEQVFYANLGKGFREFGNLKYAAKLAAAQRSEPLTLLSKEDADIQVALQNMTSSAALGSTHILYAIRQRLAVLNDGRKLDESQVPAGPICLANSFHQAAQELVLDHETRLIVYMLFDKFVLGRTSLIYDEYNQRLLKAGLLPNLKYEVHKHPVSEQQRTGSGSGGSGGAAGVGASDGSQGSGAAGQSLGDELFNNILQLLSRRDRQDSGAGSGSTVVSNPVSQTDVVSAIHQLQLRRHSDTTEAAGGVTASPGAQHDRRVVKNMLAQLSDERERLFTGIDRRRLPTADTQVIDLVGMMFEYMLNDADLPSVAKAELCRLHTPYLKIAIIDKTLFTNSRHPAHELLNMLAGAGTKWVFENDLSRGIFPTMRMIIQRIIEEFENNIEIFGELLELCRNNLRDLENKATAIEQRTRQAAAGKEKLELARTCAASAIETRVTGRNVPGELRKILADAWHDKLMFIYLREPESEYSTTWSLAVQTIENIVWSVEPRATGKALDELREKLPILRKKIERAFEMLDAYGASDNAAQLALIKKLQDAASQELTGEATGETSASGQNLAGKAGTVADQVSTDTGSTTDSAPEAIKKPVTGDKPAATVKPAPAHDKPHTGKDTKRLSPGVRKALAQVDGLAFGTWFSFSENKEASPVRLKLCWFSQVSGNYMFVDSMGVKAAVKGRLELATLLANDDIRIISSEKQSFVQRAMEAVRRMLNGNEKVLA